MLEQRFQALSGFKARSSNNFERSVAPKEKEVCSSTDFERSVGFRRSKKQARAEQSDFERDFEGTTSMIESAFEGKISMLESASEGSKSMLEQCFRTLSGLKARSRSDFECTQWPRRKKKHDRAVILRAQWHSGATKSKKEQ